MAEPIHVTDATFEKDILKAEVPVLVDFWAPWCGPCRMIAPAVEEIAREYDGRARVAKVNTDDNSQWAGRFGVYGIPTLIIFKDGEEFDRVVGVLPKRALAERLEGALQAA